MTILFSNSSPKIPKPGIFGPKFSHFCYFTKFYYYNNSKVLISNMKILFQKYPNKAFLVPNLGIFIISWCFAIKQIRRCWFQIWEQFFQIPAQKYPSKAFLVQNLMIFFSTKLCNKANSRTLIWNMTITFSNFGPKMHKLGIFGPKFKDFYFAPNFAIRQIWSIFCPKCKYF